jgi:hypothetical protein
MSTTTEDYAVFQTMAGSEIVFALRASCKSSQKPQKRFVLLEIRTTIIMLGTIQVAL